MKLTERFNKLVRAYEGLEQENQHLRRELEEARELLTKMTAGMLHTAECGRHQLDTVDARASRDEYAAHCICGLTESSDFLNRTALSGEGEPEEHALEEDRRHFLRQSGEGERP